MKRGILKVVIALVLSIVFLSPTHVRASSYVSTNVGYQSLVSETLQDFAYGGALSGSEGGSPLQGISLHLVDAPYNASIEYRVYTVDGWTNWAKNFELAQSNHQNVLGVQIRLANFEHSNVYYQTYRQGLGWGSWVKNGSTSGQLDSSHPVTGLRVQVDELGVQYQSNIGGAVQVIRHNRETQGSGLIYTVKMGLISSSASQKIEYRAYFKNSGWSSWAGDMTSIGSERAGDVITALESRLINLPGYHVRIQPQVNGEWWDWVYDGEQAGTLDTALTAYRVEIVKEKFELEQAAEVSLNPTTDPDPEPSIDPTTFNFDNPSGNACFYAALAPDESVSIGIIPSGVTNVYIELTSEVDVDLELYNNNTGESIILYEDPDSYFNVDEGNPVTGEYNNGEDDNVLLISYSGWYGDAVFDDSENLISGSQGNEWIEIIGTLSDDFEIRVYNYDESTSIEVCYQYGYDIPQ